MATVLVVDDNEAFLSLLTLLFENAGYRVIAAGRGKQALDLLESHAPELAVLDVLLPDMVGFQLADEILKRLPGLPIVFMTGVFKGGRHGLEAKQKYGAAYFEKPFDAEKLKEAVIRLLPPQAPKAEPTEAFFEVELDIDVDEGPVDPMELTGKIQVTDDARLTAEIRGANFTVEAMSSGPAPLPRDFESQRSKTATEPAGRSRKGEIRDNFPALINAFYLAKETGELGVQRGKVKKIVFFENGVPVFAASNLAADRFGAFLLRVGKVGVEALNSAVQVAAESQRRTGDVLVERGLLNPTERLYYVGQQVKAIIYSLFAWESGTYVLSFRERVRAEPIKLDVHPANLIVRGIKKLYSLERLRRLIRPEDRLLPSPNPAYPLDEVRLENWEAQLLPKVDGTRTAAELIVLAGKPEKDVLSFLCSLSCLGILDKYA